MRATASHEEDDIQVERSSANSGVSISHLPLPPYQHQRCGPSGAYRVKYGPIGLQHAKMSLSHIVRLLRAIVKDCKPRANLLWAGFAKLSQQLESVAAHGHSQSLLLAPCKLASLRIALSILIHMLLDWLRAWLASLGQQQQQQKQQLEPPPCYTHSSLLTASNLLKLALLLVTAWGVWTDISRMVAAASSDEAVACTRGRDRALTDGAPTADVPTAGPSQDREVPWTQSKVSPTDQSLACGAEEAEAGRPPLYRSRYSQRYRVTVKVPVHQQELPDISARDVQARLSAIHPTLRIQRLGVRSGCFILDLECLDLRSPGAPYPGASSSSAAAGWLSDAGWLELLDVYGIASPALVPHETLVASLHVGSRSAQLSYNTATGAWVQAPAAGAPVLQLPPQCLLLGSQAELLSLTGPGIAADGNHEEVVRGGRRQPCRVVSKSHGAGQQDVVVLELELGGSCPGVTNCNVWSSGGEPDRLLATQPLLLLPPGSAEAAAQLAGIAADAGLGATALDLFQDLGELLEATAPPQGQAAALLVEAGAGDFLALSESASNLHAWCQQAGYLHVAQLVAGLADRLPDLIGHVSAARRSEAGGKVADAASSSCAPNQSYVQPSRRALAPPRGRRGPGALWATVKELDSAPASCRSASSLEQQLSAALPPRMWTLFVMFKFLVACRRSMVSGTGLFEATALAIWTLPYAAVFCWHTAAAPTRQAVAQRSACVRWLARNSRLLLHVHRTAIFIIMACGLLPVPFVLQLAFSKSLTTYPIKLLYMCMECYAWQAAVPFLLLVDTPVLYTFSAWLHLPRSMLHASIVNLLAMSIHAGMPLLLTHASLVKRKKL